MRLRQARLPRLLLPHSRQIVRARAPLSRVHRVLGLSPAARRILARPDRSHQPPLAADSRKVSVAMIGVPLARHLVAANSRAVRVDKAVVRADRVAKAAMVRAVVSPLAVRVSAVERRASVVRSIRKQ